MPITLNEALPPMFIQECSEEITPACGIYVSHHKALFRKLAEQWEKETAGLPRLKDRFSHSAYLKIINLGDEAVPFLLEELKKDAPDHWFEALFQIKRVDPVPTEQKGDVRKMADAWIQWGRRTGWTN